MSRKISPNAQMAISLVALAVLTLCGIGLGYWMGRYMPEGDARYVLLLSFVMVVVFFAAVFLTAEAPIRAWREADRELRRVTTSDPLTGLLNRTAVMERLGRESSRSQRTGESLALATVSIDDLDGIQQRFGQATRSTVLRCVGTLVGSSCRQYDAAGRYGTNAFLMVLPGTDLDGAARACERLRDRVQNSEFACDGTGYTVTVSIGVTQVDVNARESTEDLMQRVENALKDAHAEGGNLVRATAPIDIVSQG